MQEFEIDAERLRKDLINYFEGAFFAGGFGGALNETSEIKSADLDELIEIAEENNFDLEDYYME